MARGARRLRLRAERERQTAAGGGGTGARQPGGRGANANLKLHFEVAELEALDSEGPYASYYPEESVSAELLRHRGAHTHVESCGSSPRAQSSSFMSRRRATPTMAEAKY